MTPDEVEVSRRKLLAELTGMHGSGWQVRMQPDMIRDLVALLEALKPVVVDRAWWITTGPFTDPLCKKIAGPFISHDEAIANRARIEEYALPVTFWVDTLAGAKARAALYPKATEGLS
jgi:hypothetical protein